MGGGGEHQSCKNYSVGVLALPAQVSTGKGRRGSLPPWDLAVRGEDCPCVKQNWKGM